MKVSLFKSVGAKLFYLMSSLVLLTVAGNSAQSFLTFKGKLEDKLQESASKEAESIASIYGTRVDLWKSQVQVALPTLRSIGPLDGGGKDGAERAAVEGFRRFVDSCDDCVSLALYSAPSGTSTELTSLGFAFTSKTKDEQFEDKEPTKVEGTLRSLSASWLRRQVGPLAKSHRDVGIESVAPQTALPLMVMAFRFGVNGKSSVVWAVLTTWQTSLMKYLPKSPGGESSVVDASGKIFTSHKLDDMVKRKAIGAKELWRKAKSDEQPNGFLAKYKDTEGRLRFGAYARIPQYGLTVINDQDYNVAHEVLRRVMFTSALIGTLYVLFAVLFAFFGAASITKGLRAVTYATGRIAAGDLKYQIPPGSQDEVGALGVSVNHMSRKIVELMKSTVDKARFEKELETAKMVQSTFFPKEDIKADALMVSGFYEPASECGGDLWGHYTIEPGIEFVFIADAMGHGAPAALVTAMAYSTTMTIADIIKSEKGFRDSPAKILDRLNRIIYEAVRGTISMTFFGALIDTRRGTIAYANAGHNFPVVVPLDPSDPRCGKPGKKAKASGGVQPISLKLMGTPLGMDPQTVYKEQTLELKAGDKLFFFTDGLIECTSPKGEAWGRKYLLEQVAEAARLGAEAMKNEVIDKAFSFFGTKELDDDVTVVVAELSRDWMPKEAPVETPVMVEAVAAAPVEEAPAMVEPVAEVAAPVVEAPVVEAPAAEAAAPTFALEPVEVYVPHGVPPAPVAARPAPAPLADPVSLPPRALESLDLELDLEPVEPPVAELHAEPIAQTTPAAAAPWAPMPTPASTEAPSPLPPPLPRAAAPVRTPAPTPAPAATAPAAPMRAPAQAPAPQPAATAPAAPMRAPAQAPTPQPAAAAPASAAPTRAPAAPAPQRAPVTPPAPAARAPAQPAPDHRDVARAVQTAAKTTPPAGPLESPAPLSQQPGSAAPLKLKGDRSAKAPADANPFAKAPYQQPSAVPANTGKQPPASVPPVSMRGGKYKIKLPGTG